MSRMADDSIHERITALVNAEHELRQQLQAGQISSADERARLQSLEVQLDQCWDLLRQRRARRSAGLDPDTASPRDATVVEHYQQ